MGSYSTFVVKIWTDKNRRVARGQIQHVGSEEIVRFVDTGKMLQFILAHLDSPADSASLSQARGRGEGVDDASDS